MEHLDSLDRKILHELDTNSRQSYSELAKKTRSKKDTVKYRIEKLIKEEVIEGFYSVIDYSKLGFLLFRFYFQVSDISLEKKQELVTYLKNHKNISIFYRVTGKYDFSFSIWAKDVWDYEKFWDEFTEKFGTYLLDHHLAIKTKYTEFSRNYLLGKADEKEQFTVSQKSKKEELDEFDLKIITLLSTNSRITLVDLSRKVKTSVVTCRSRLKNLIKKKVIVGFRIKLNYEKLGYQYYKVDLWFGNMQKRSAITQAILSHPNVIYTEKTLVTSNFEFDLEVKGFTDFISIMDSFEKKFPDDIKKYEYYTLIKNYKVNYLPSL